MKDKKSIVVRKNEELTTVDQIVRVDEEGCLACLHGSPEIPCDGVVFISQIKGV